MKHLHCLYLANEGCLNFREMPFLNSTTCVCEAEAADAIYRAAYDTRALSAWTLGGLCGIIVGTIICMVNTSAVLGEVYAGKTEEK